MSSNFLIVSASILLVFCINAALVNGEEHPLVPEKGQVIGECMKELGISEDQFKAMKENYQKAPDSPMKEGMCFSKCLITKLGLTDASGTIDVKKTVDHAASIKSQVKPDELKACLEKVAKVTACEHAFEVVKCFRAPM